MARAAEKAAYEAIAHSALLFHEVSVVMLTDAERTELEGRARSYTSPYSDVVRAKIVLYAAEGLGNDEIAARLDTPRQVVSKWRKRFHEQRLPGLADQPRGGRPPSFSP